MTVQIQKWGNSQGIRLPKYILKEIQWGESEELTIKTEEGKIILEKVCEKKNNIKERFANFNGEYEGMDMDGGTAIGKEIW